VPKKERDRWGRDIQNYLLNRNSLRLIFHLIDSRHPPTPLDEDFFYWMASNEKPFAVLMTKSDKLSANKLGKSKSIVRKTLKEMNIDVPLVSCSADSGSGIEEVQSLVTDFYSS